ncbi:MAG TPA: PAS domain-containing sensor histidine kinase [Candidatus Sulfotelmatobacter sp.]|nr:PAS domain-containing sensor histidine kinase [Candidatus Sulfotelmatobacter sp.]
MKKKHPSRKTKVRKTEKTALPADSTPRGLTDYEKDQFDLQTHSALLELASDAVLVRNLEGSILLWNRGAERMYGWTKEEALGKKIFELLETTFPTPDDKIHQNLLRHGYWEGELIHTRKDGEQRYVESRWSLHRRGNRHTILELNTDITDRKRYEKQLQELSGQLMQVQDEERRRIARDLHDSTGQKLVALKLSLAQSDKPSASLRQEQSKLVDDILQDIRTLSQLLHPPLLEESGLLSATRWLVDGFSDRAGIKVSLDAPDRIERLPSNVEIALFRIIQEALNNIHRHSGAGNAQVEVKTMDGSLVLKITDDGHGMNGPGSQRSGDPRLGVGLLGMRERLSQLGGRLIINSSEKGTCIEAQVPLSNSSLS